MLNLMYITNNPQIALIAERSGVNRIFVDMEYIGKRERQAGMNTVQNHHTFEDIKAVKNVITKAEILVRCNPIHNASDSYCSSEEEINKAIEAGADILMLPYFKTVAEVKEFVRLVNGRVKILPLLETPEAVECVDELLRIKEIKEIFIGLNDLSLGYGMKFMFEPLSNGIVEKLCAKFKALDVNYGFGGIASIGKGDLPSEKIIAEHYRLGSTCAILSRSFCNVNLINNLEEISFIFDSGLKKIRECEDRCRNGEVDLLDNKKQVDIIVKKIVESKK